MKKTTITILALLALHSQVFASDEDTTTAIVKISDWPAYCAVCHGSACQLRDLDTDHGDNIAFKMVSAHYMETKKKLEYIKSADRRVRYHTYLQKKIRKYK